MLYLEYTRNRIVFISATTIATAVLFAVTVHGINAVGVLLATALINILVYYALPDRYSPAYLNKYSISETETLLSQSRRDRGEKQI